ncbi:MAG: hypothetical protein HS101_18455 [Planctomycetia bacterium]|nr:hypothetical protein [Planctomycetia bacterium]
MGDKKSEIEKEKDNPVLQILEAGTCAIGMSRRDWMRRGGSFLQRCVGSNVVEATAKEWRQLRDEGRIKSDYQNTEQCGACLYELLESLEKDSVDHERMKLIKRIFLAAATEEKSTRRDNLPLEFIRTARSLSAGEILVLRAGCHLHDTLDVSKENEARKLLYWHNQLAGQSGLKHSGLTDVHCGELAKKGLMDRRFTIVGEAYVTARDLITSYGKALCDFAMTDADPLI